jgi:hypothetical protein
MASRLWWDPRDTIGTLPIARFSYGLCCFCGLGVLCGSAAVRRTPELLIMPAAHKSGVTAKRLFFVESFEPMG